MASKKIILMTVQPPVKSFLPVNNTIIPLHLATLIGFLRDKGYELTFLDNYFKECDWLNTIQTLSPDYVVIYADQLSCLNTKTYLEQINLINIQQSEKPFKVIIIGPQAIFEPGNIPESVDYVVDGCYETVLPSLIENLPEEKLISGNFTADYDSFRIPDWGFFIPTGNPLDCEYDLTDVLFGDVFPVFDLKTVKGCQSKLSYLPCCSLKYSAPVLLPAKNIFEQVKHLQQHYNVQALRFQDYDFASDRERLQEFCELIQPTGIFWTCCVKPGSVNLEDLKLMKSAGCKLVHVQFETASSRLLELLNADYTVEQAKILLKMLKKVNLKISIEIKYALPSEAEQDQKLNEAFVNEFKPDYIQNSVFVSLPGSVLYQHAQEYPHRMDENGLIIPANWELLAKKYLKLSYYSGLYQDKSFLSNPLPELIFHKKKTYIESQLEYIDTIPLKSKIYLYGATNLAKVFIKKYKMEEYNIKGIFDDDLSKSGRFRPTKFTIYHSSEIKKLAPDYIFLTLDSPEQSQKVKQSIMKDLMITKKPEILSVFYDGV